MTKARKDGLTLIFLGAMVILLITGYLFQAKSRGACLDFLPDYNSARCLIRGCDPYNETQVFQNYRAEGGERSLSDPLDRAVATRYVYPPSAFAVMVPFALLPWGPAHILWTVLSVCLFILAAGLAWDLTGDRAPVLCGALIGYMLANSEILVVLSNPSELVIALCVIAVWSFIRNRFVWVGVVCLALSLAVKPQDPGLIWLYFLLAGGAYRKRALQTLLLTVLISAPFVLWVWMANPHWMQELHGNLAAFSQRGGLNDPGPANDLSIGFVDLQVMLSRFYDHPGFYNLVSYLAFLPPFVVWIAITVRSRLTPENTLLALASITPLSMLPIHHHLYDTKLILLTLPAMALLRARAAWNGEPGKGGIRKDTGWIAISLTGGVLFFSGDLSNWLVSKLAGAVHTAPGTPSPWLADALLVFPTPLLLLATGIFYLIAYRRSIEAEPSRALEPVG